MRSFHHFAAAMCLWTAKEKQLSRSDTSRENLWKSGHRFLSVQHCSLGSAPPSRQRGWVDVGVQINPNHTLDPHPPTQSAPPPTPQAHRHTFHNIAARLRDHKTRAALGFCDALKQVFR